MFNRLSCIALNDAAYGLSAERWFRSMLFSGNRRHEILSNINRKNLNEINPARAGIPSLSFIAVIIV